MRPVPTGKPLLVISFALRLVALGVLVCRAGGLQAQGASAAAPVMFVRHGTQLEVPAGSPLQGRLQVAVVGTAAAAAETVLPASVEADPSRSVNIVAPLAGRLVSLQVRLGDTVRRGRLLATIASPDLTQAVADATKARDALDLAQRALARAQGVNAAGSNATKDVEAAQSAVLQQAAERDRSEARLKALGMPAGSPAGQALPLTAPFDGVVTALNVGAGAFLSDTAAPLMTIANLDRVWVTVAVPENLLARVAVGQTASVTLAAYPGRRYTGRIDTISPVLDADTRRARARIAFANTDHALKPNMVASAALALARDGSALPEVPASALLMNNDRVSVFVEVRPGTFERRVVELGREDGDRVRIASGLAAGERVVVRGGVLLND